MKKGEKHTKEFYIKKDLFEFKEKDLYLSDNETNMDYLATSNFEFYYFDFIKQFNLDFDVIINNKENTAFWLNEFKNGI